MRHCTVVLLVIAMLSATPASAQAPTGGINPQNSKKWVTSRMPDGTPDVQGLWNFRTATPLERPPEFVGREFLSDLDIAVVERQAAERLRVDGPTDALLNTPPFWLDSGTRVVSTHRSSLIVEPRDGRLPAMTPAGLRRGAALLAARTAMIGPESLTPWERCITRGLPAVMLPSSYNNNLQILQTPGYVVLVSEMIHEVRIVPVDGRVSGTQGLRAWMGYSSGRWEGDTLVVETKNFLAQADFMGLGNRFLGAAQQLRLVEHFTRMDADTIDYRFTVDDPITWTQPWTVAIPLVKTESPMYEYACHEGNHNLANILSIARSRESAERQDQR
jgi:hypothetical protein